MTEYEPTKATGRQNQAKTERSTSMTTSQTQTSTPRSLVLVTILMVALAGRVIAASAEPPSGIERHAAIGLYDFGGASEEALSLYRQGWREILLYGRWTEAERLYREAVATDPDFLIAKSVLARITLDAEERQALYREVKDRRASVDDDGQLLLNTYQTTLELFAQREAGEVIDPSFRKAMARRAVNEYEAFLEKYPREWSVTIEYVEWVHNLQGPVSALQTIERIQRSIEDEVSFSYFPAYFEAELGNHARAAALADRFAARIDDRSSPQPHYLRAYLAYERGDLEAAQASIARALALDPRHLIAERLQRQLTATM
jgi:tetratricopeptide (TPR) repeat protein